MRIRWTVSKGQILFYLIYFAVFTVMGQDISKSITPPQLSLTDYIVDGQIDITRYIYYQKRTYGIGINGQLMPME